MQIKISLGKLRFDLPLAEIIEEQRRVNGSALLPIETAHIYALADLPLHHKDPFDRLLIAQAVGEHLTVVTSDPAFASYQVSVLW